MSFRQQNPVFRGVMNETELKWTLFVTSFKPNTQNLHPTPQCFAPKCQQPTPTPATLKRGFTTEMRKLCEGKQCQRGGAKEKGEESIYGGGALTRGSNQKG